MIKGPTGHRVSIILEIYIVFGFNSHEMLEAVGNKSFRVCLCISGKLIKDEKSETLPLQRKKKITSSYTFPILSLVTFSLRNHLICCGKLITTHTLQITSVFCCGKDGVILCWSSQSGHQKSTQPVLRAHMWELKADLHSRNPSFQLRPWWHSFRACVLGLSLELLCRRYHLKAAKLICVCNWTFQAYTEHKHGTDCKPTVQRHTHIFPCILEDKDWGCFLTVNYNRKKNKFFIFINSKFIPTNVMFSLSKL